ncbi:MAG: hypothetical protein GWN94_01635, partial [Phycisphaerae bacterium]|nr:hypothetical protein [Phycisphaerae bacterium]
TGSLQVTISPPGAVTAGAQWRVDGGAWRDSDYTETGLTVGSHTVEYSTVAGWDTPANEVVQINDGLTTITMGIYIAQSGSLQVTILPQGAIDAGAQWRLFGGTWRNSGYTESDLPIGWYTVEFSEVEGWNKPVSETVQIHNSQLTTVIGNYIEQAGASLMISEFMASNASALPLEQGEMLDGNGDSSDWIEIYNPTDTTVSLDGWYLTDSDVILTKWPFPDGNQLDPGEFMIIFASQKTYAENPLNYPYLDPAGYYHTNFELNKAGDYLALVAPDGNTIIHEYAPEYPDQLTNISYGLAQYSEMLVPTGATATYHVPTISDAGLGTDWTDPNFDDSSWDTGETALGFAGGSLESGQDIGNPTAAGSYSVSNGVYTVLGDGNDIWNTGDSFYYVYTPLHGDGELIARVLSVQQTDNWAKAGVMFRETLDAGSKFSDVLLTGANGCRMQERNSTNGSAVSDSSVATTEQKAINAPYWIRLKRENLTTFRGYYSADGVVWTELAWSPRTIDMAEDCYVGLCVTSHSNGVLCTAEFDNISFGNEVGADLKASMLGVNASLWTRIEFEVEDPNTLDSLKLRMKYEDGFVAYLNGQQIAEQNAPASLQWNSTATSDRPIEDSSVFEEFNIMSFIHLLLPKPQKNVLAIHGLNDDPANEEFLILPELVGASNLSVPQYFASPTPGTFNITGAEGIVSDVWFSHKRGFYDASFQLRLSTEMDNAEIRYTTDGSRPTIIHGSTFNYNTDPPINIDTTTTIRAVAVRPGWLDSPVETHTYIFLDDVIQQPTNPPGFPTSGWGYAGPDYEMDPEVVVSYSSTIKDDLKAVPTLSLAMDVNDWFGSDGQGIYIQGELSERAVSAELIFPDGNDGFQIDCAVMIVGGSSVNRWKMDKLSMRLKFQSAFGPTKLRFPLFGDKATDEFDTIVVDARMNNSWAYGGSVGINRPGLGQRDVAQYTRDQFVSDIQNAMGGYGGQGRHVHLYLNGLYWGLYWLHERPDEHFAAAYFGGQEEDYDVLKHNSGTVVNGSATNYNQMFTVANAGLESDSQYQLIKEYLDVPGLIDYLLTNFYVGNTDWDHHNWYASRSRVNPASRWLYHSWDAEHVMEGLNDDVTGKNNSGASTRLHQQLAQNTEYKLLFADHMHRHLFNSGVLTPEGATALYNIRLNDVDRAVVGESARWGDNHRTVPYTRDIEWITERDWLLNTYFQQRTNILFEDLKGRDFYPDVNAPVFSRHGGWDPTGFNISMSSSSGTIYYTTDGNDPRVPISQSSPGSEITLVTENATRKYLVPTGPLAGSTGSILREYWTGISGTAVSNLTSSPDYPGNPDGIDYLSTFETSTNWADNYGTRVRGYLHPPTDGSYTFWISSDDASELWLSTDDNPTNKVLIAFETNWSSARVWQLGGNEESAPITLVGGQKYYIEALQKEGSGGDNLAVAWSLDNNPPVNGDPPIDGAYLSPAGDTWATTYFDDSSWPGGTGGVGYERNPGDPINFLGLFNINVEGNMYGSNGTCYIRIPFNVSNTDLSSMTLKIRYDDGFIAYLNGAEVARRNFIGTPQWDSAATAENPDSAAINFENIDISGHTGILQTGNNVLAIQGLNISAADSDFLISAELVATEISQGDVSPSAIPYSGEVPLARTTNLKARVLDGSIWSALNEAIFAVGHVADYLRVTEIMYHPKYTGDPNDPNTE